MTRPARNIPAYVSHLYIICSFFGKLCSKNVSFRYFVSGSVASTRSRS